MCVSEEREDGAEEIAVGRESLIDFFEHLIAEKKKVERHGEEEIAEEGRREVDGARGGWRGPSHFLPSLSFLVAFGCTLRYLCCHGNSLDSREESRRESERIA